MAPNRYLIRFEGLSAAEASLAAEDLRRALQRMDPTLTASLVRTDPEALVFGTGLEVLLAAPATGVLARGISNWLARSHTSKVTVIGPDGKTIVEGITARQAFDLAEKLSGAGR